MDTIISFIWQIKYAYDWVGDERVVAISTIIIAITTMVYAWFTFKIVKVTANNQAVLIEFNKNAVLSDLINESGSRPMMESRMAAYLLMKRSLSVKNASGYWQDIRDGQKWVDFAMIAHFISRVERSIALKRADEKKIVQELFWLASWAMNLEVMYRHFDKEDRIVADLASFTNRVRLHKDGQPKMLIPDIQFS